MVVPPPDAATSAGWELRSLLAVQDRLSHRPPVLHAARALGTAGEHAATWLALGAVGAATDRARRPQWLRALTVIAAAHAVAVVLKRVVRRPRPSHPGLRLLVPTVSGLAFPSSHVASTTAAALQLGRLTGVPLAPALPAAMATARVTVGAHYPTDVLAGAVIGWAVDRFARGRGGHPV